MNATHLKSGFGCALMGLALAVPAAHAQMMEAPVDAIDVNLVGLAIGAAPDYMGSKDNTTVAGPILRYQFKGSQRYFLWLGPTMQLNLIDSATWRAGPMLNFRAKRDADVEDSVVKRMKEVDSQVEAGVFVQYNMKLSSAPMHQLVFSGDYAGGEGNVGHLRMMYWHPFAPGIFGNIGVGLTYGDDKFVKNYFGVTGTDIALFPSLAGKPYAPGGGITGFNVPFGLSMMLSREWLGSIGARYESLQDDAKDSPIVKERGDSSQWVYGIALSYLF